MAGGSPGLGPPRQRTDDSRAGRAGDWDLFRSGPAGSGRIRCAAYHRPNPSVAGPRCRSLRWRAGGPRRAARPFPAEPGGAPEAELLCGRRYRGSRGSCWPRISGADSGIGTGSREQLRLGRRGRCWRGSAGGGRVPLAPVSRDIHAIKTPRRATPGALFQLWLRFQAAPDSTASTRRTGWQ